jgi:hypothetical protein
MSLDPCLGVESQLQPYLDHFEAKLRDTVKTVCCGDPVPEGLVERVRLHCRGQGAA